MIDQYGRYVATGIGMETTTTVKSDGGTHVLVYPPRVSAPGGGVEGGIFFRGRER